MKKSFEQKEKEELKRKFEFLKKNPWIIKMWEEQEDARNEYSKKQFRIEQKYCKISKRHGIKNIWLASTMEGDTFGIDINNVQAKGEGKDRYLIHDSDIEKFEERFSSKKPKF